MRFGLMDVNVGKLPEQEITLASVCKAKGYATGHFGKWHLGTMSRNESPRHKDPARDYAPPWARDYDDAFASEISVPTWNPASGRFKEHSAPYWHNGTKVTENLQGDDSRVIMDRAIPFIKKAVDAGKPFMTTIWFHAPHSPVVAGPDYLEMYEGYTEGQRHYYGCITALDEQVGRLRSELRKLGVDQNTIIWFCSDNGPEGSGTPKPVYDAYGGAFCGKAGDFRGRKRFLYNGGVCVPALAVWPGTVAKGQTVAMPCSTLDYLPTLCEAIGSDLLDERPIDGESLLPLLLGKKKNRESSIPFASNIRLPRAAIIQGDFKLCTNLSESGTEDELFHLHDDPAEENNLINAHSQLAASMKAQLREWVLSCRKSFDGEDYSEPYESQGSFLIVETDKQQLPPNIILLITDDQGYGDVSAHGSPDVLTPNMDMLKSQGISLDDFHASPTCAPTRSAIMTARHPFKSGITHTILERERMTLEATTLPQVLKRAAYSCGIFGKWHLGDEPRYQPGSRGFDEVFIHGAGAIGTAFPGSCADVPGNNYFDPIIKYNGVFVKTEGFCTDVFFTQAMSWIEQKSTGDKPFFACITTNAPHEPFLAPEKYKEKFKEKGYLENTQGFYGMVENIDDNLGLLINKVEELGIADNTVLIFMSDNGKTGASRSNGKAYNAGMKGYKGSVNEGGSRVPFFIRWPGKFEAGRVLDAMQNHYDILPTLADIASIDISDIRDMDGRSFLPYLEDESHRGEDRYRFFHAGRWPLNPENVGDIEINERWVGTAESSDPDTYKYKNCAVRNERFRFVKNSELYDLYNDPGESTDVAAKHPEIVEQMRKAYDQWWSEVRPLMVNEDALLTKERPFWVEYEKQKNSTGILPLGVSE